MFTNTKGVSKTKHFNLDKKISKKLVYKFLYTFVLCSAWVAK